MERGTFYKIQIHLLLRLGDIYTLLVERMWSVYVQVFILTPGVTNIWQITTIKDKKSGFIKVENGISFIQVGAKKEVITTTQSKIIYIYKQFLLLRL